MCLTFTIRKQKSYTITQSRLGRIVENNTSKQHNYNTNNTDHDNQKTKKYQQTEGSINWAPKGKKQAIFHNSTIILTTNNNNNYNTISTKENPERQERRLSEEDQNQNYNILTYKQNRPNKYSPLSSDLISEALYNPC